MKEKSSLGGVDEGSMGSEEEKIGRRREEKGKGKGSKGIGTRTKGFCVEQMRLQLKELCRDLSMNF